MQPAGWDVASGLESSNQRAGVRESETESSERAVGVSALCLRGAGRCAARAGDETLPEPLVTEAGSVFPVVVVQHFFSSCAVQGDGAAPLLATGRGPAASLQTCGSGITRWQKIIHRILWVKS